MEFFSSATKMGAKRERRQPIFTTGQGSRHRSQWDDLLNERSLHIVRLLFWGRRPRSSKGEKDGKREEDK